MPTLRVKPYYWISWLAPLLSGEDSCEWKTWLKGNYQNIRKLPSDFDAAQWNENHTALLTELRDEYGPKAAKVLTEGQTSWKIEGKTATVAGKMDLITIDPNLVIDAKTGKQKNAHVMQVKAYLLAIELGAVPGVSGEFKGVLRYGSHAVEVPGADPVFRDRFFSLVKRLVSMEPAAIPSMSECRYCDLADCKDRMTIESAALQTAEF